MKISLIQLQRADRENGMGLYIDLTQIESFTPGERVGIERISHETIIGMRSGDKWHVRGCISEVMDECFDAMRGLSPARHGWGHTPEYALRCAIERNEEQIKILQQACIELGVAKDVRSSQAGRKDHQAAQDVDGCD